MVLSLRHHVQRTITYKLSALYPPIVELSPALRAKLAEMDELSELAPRNRVRCRSLFKRRLITWANPHPSG